MLKDCLMPILSSIGHFTIIMMSNLGRLVHFLLNSLLSAVRPPWYRYEISKQFIQIGFYSLPVVGLTAIFTGMVLALQCYTGFARFNASSGIAAIVVVTITRELGPVLAGRVGASMAAEIGTMRVTEQIDALTTLSTNPFKYLVFPRLLAGLVTLPFLVLIADCIGVFGGYLVAIYKLDFNSAMYIHQTLDSLETQDVMSGLIKAAVFGVVITLMGCYHGYQSGRGAAGVGRATTNAVVSSSILILCMNYILTALLFNK